MTIEEAIRAYLLTRTAVTAITSKIYLDQTDEQDRFDTATVLITVEKVDDDWSDNQTIMGDSDKSRATVAISALCTVPATARALAEAIRVNGTNPGTGLSNAKVRWGDATKLDFDAMRESLEFGYVPDQDGGDNGFFDATSMYNVFFQQVT